MPKGLFLFMMLQGGKPSVTCLMFGLKKLNSTLQIRIVSKCLLAIKLIGTLKER
uniref:Uncharacterized protein n=1 Tax=Rhizophora mucronata TaxID=61149 RepID=A0A2P2NXX8_RHIMU